jgi:hypothetical protein
MEHTLRAMRITIASMGVFMTASEANRERVLTLLRFEREQMSAEFIDFSKEIPAINRGEWFRTETSQPSIVERFLSSPLDVS